MSVKSLLTGLADSIRLKSGKSGKLSLEEMAAALMGVTVEGDVAFTCGSFTASATGAAQTIEHGLGQVPGAVLFFKKSSIDSISSSTTTYFYDSLLSIVYGAEAGHAYCYHYFRRATSSSTSSTSNRTWSNSTAIPSTMFGTGHAANSYYVTNINETSFKTPSRLVSGRTYVWIAFRAPLV